DRALGGGTPFSARAHLCAHRAQPHEEIDVPIYRPRIEEGSRMAKESGQEKSLHELRQEVAHSRDWLARDLSGLRYELDFPLKFRKSFQRQTVLWITAAVVIGIVLAVMPARTKKIPLKVKGKMGNGAKEGILGAGLA